MRTASYDWGDIKFEKAGNETEAMLMFARLHDVKRNDMN